VRMGAMGRVSLNCNLIARFVHFVMIPLFLLILIILSFPPFFCSTFSLIIISSLPHACSLCLVNFFSHSFFYSIPSFPPLLGLSWMNTNSGHLPYPFLAVLDHDLFDRCLGSTVNNGSICASSANLNYCLHLLTQHLQFPPQCRDQCRSQVLPL
jgi:hypothetical protein